MKRTLEEFLEHGHLFAAIRIKNGRWQAYCVDGWYGGRDTIRNELWNYCGPDTNGEARELWRDLREAVERAGGQYVFPVKRWTGQRDEYEVIPNPAPPVVQAIDTGKHWRVDCCPFCGGKHIHGRGPGHRWEHCHGRRAALPGYVLTLARRRTNAAQGHLPLPKSRTPLVGQPRRNSQDEQPKP